MNYEQFTALVQEKEAHLFDYQKNGFLLFTHDGSHVHRLTDLSSESLQAAHDFLESPASNDLPQKESISADIDSFEQMLTVNLRLNILFASETTSALNNAIAHHIDTAQILLRFQFQKPPNSWVQVLDSFCAHWQEKREKQRLFITLSGTFSELFDDDLTFLVKNDIQLEYVYPFEEGISHFLEESKDVISHIAGRGLRLPIVWYINAKTVKQVLPLIEEAMFLNFHSGFSLPLAHHSLFVEPLQEPDEMSYLTLLADIYEHYPFYDDLLFPLNFACINALKLGKLDFWKIVSFDSKSAVFSPMSASTLDGNVLAFFARLFLWQRWEVKQLYEHWEEVAERNG